jgi:hypothetical protein
VLLPVVWTTLFLLGNGIGAIQKKFAAVSCDVLNEFSCHHPLLFGLK